MFEKSQADARRLRLFKHPLRVFWPTNPWLSGPAGQRTSRPEDLRSIGLELKAAFVRSRKSRWAFKPTVSRRRGQCSSPTSKPPGSLQSSAQGKKIEARHRQFLNSKRILAAVDIPWQKK